ncbi:MAG TPA: tRNA (adenosine(37)-N6)-threonylcarbamoyltransferase complex dimerization subunit type 1 TsaB [Terracidiphilus sp.]|jgi:tRNA threonylcarbamoyladenosine biosynthesis protein TsaB|nr:tRNA (adenosine(37)-N6)-threonylcarbamoyltransferase complex dimerization subunit type 1 TsaB [Terracidiphilus sp.]
MLKGKMTDETPNAETRPAGERLVLGIDTCGPSGSVALARLGAEGVHLLGQIALEGKTYAATLVSAVEELLQKAGTDLSGVGAIAVTSGPGSFTGVRVGLSAVKGLAEPRGIPVVAVSRLEVLALKAGVEAAALDAHRHEVFIRLTGEGARAREILAGRADLDAVTPRPLRVAVSDDAALELLKSLWEQAELMIVTAPTAADAIELAAARIRVGKFVDLALLDGHYLRRSDAEIFGNPSRAVRKA